MGSTSESKAAPVNTPVSDHVKGDSVKHPRAGQVIAASGRQAEADREAERSRLTGTPVGPGSGNRLVDADGNEVSDLHGLHDDTGETIVTLKSHVYEEFAAPGAPNRKIKRLLFHAGQQVPKSVLQRHQDALEANSDEVERLAGLGSGTGHPLEGEDATFRNTGSGVAEPSNSKDRTDDPSGSPDPAQPGEGEGTTVPPDGDGEGETKEGGAGTGEPKEGRRGRVPTRN